MKRSQLVTLVGSMSVPPMARAALSMLINFTPDEHWNTYAPLLDQLTTAWNEYKDAQSRLVTVGGRAETTDKLRADIRAVFVKLADQLVDIVLLDG